MSNNLQTFVLSIGATVIKYDGKEYQSTHPHENQLSYQTSNVPKASVWIDWKEI